MEPLLLSTSSLTFKYNLLKLTPAFIDLQSKVVTEGAVYIYKKPDWSPDCDSVVTITDEVDKNVLLNAADILAKFNVNVGFDLPLPTLKAVGAAVITVFVNAIEVQAGH